MPELETPMSTMTTSPHANLNMRLQDIPEDALTSLRTEANESFQKMGWPSMRDEAWRYTDTRKIASTEFSTADPGASVEIDRLAPYMLGQDMPRMIFVDGIYQPSLSTAESSSEVRIDRIADVIASEPDRLMERLAAHAQWKDDPANALSTMMLTDGVMVEIAAGADMTSPIHVIYYSSGGDQPISIHPRILVVAGDGSSGTVIETHAGDTDNTILTAPVTELIAGDNVNLDHYRMIREGSNTSHLGDLAMHQGASSEVSSCVLAFDGPLIRSRMRATLAGEHGNAILHGLALGHDTRHVENLLRVNHMVPNCRSREEFKHVLDDKSSAAFTGRIYVAEGAQKTDAVQTNRNLVLTKTGKAVARPQLEIYADDVKCTHGATTGELDPEAMFYLQARGVPADAARGMLIQAFAGEILDDVRPQALREQAMMLLRDRLPAAEHLAMID
tara:strand:- start:1836 stop:3173 length:1338 start_codon:yes stop_codon:yes gene_type:complete